MVAAGCGVRGRPVVLWLGVDQVRLGGEVEAALGAFDGVGERVGRLGEAGAMAEEDALGLQSLHFAGALQSDAGVPCGDSRKGGAPVTDTGDVELPEVDEGIASEEGAIAIVPKGDVAGGVAGGFQSDKGPDTITGVQRLARTGLNADIADRQVGGLFACGEASVSGKQASVTFRGHE